MITKQSFIEEHRHWFGGYMLEAVYAGRRDEMLAKWLRAAMQDIDRRLARMYDELNPQPPPQAAQPQVNNGKAESNKRV